MEYLEYIQKIRLQWRSYYKLYRIQCLKKYKNESLTAVQLHAWSLNLMLTYCVFKTVQHLKLKLASTENKSLPRNWLKLVLGLMGSPYLFDNFFEEIQQKNKMLCCSCCRLLLTKLLYLHPEPFISSKALLRPSLILVLSAFM